LLFALPEQAAATLRERFVVAGEPIWEIGRVVEGAGIDVSGRPGERVTS
jgi:hypothetical protein